MSKFFKALEKVEAEQATGGRPRTDDAPATPADDELRPGASPATPQASPTTAPPRTDGTAPAPVAEARRAEASEGRLPAYGVPTPVDERARPPRRRGFAWQVEPAADLEAGELDDHLVSLLAPTSRAAEQYRAVRLAVETYRRERGTRVVAISSAGRGDGKTITAINLAGALAQAPDSRVALVEADLRHPSVARYLGLPAARGLGGYLLDPGLPVDAIVQHPSTIAFAVVTAGGVSAMPYELLKSPRLSALFATLRERFDFVVVDTTPVLPYPDAGILREAVDGFILVVRANRTPRELLRDSFTAIGGQRSLGVVFNDDERAAGAPASGADVFWRRYLTRPRGTARVA